MNITLMAFGSRGDVQPFLALAIALRERGHSVTLAAPNDFEAQITAYGVQYGRIPVSFKALLETDMSQTVMRKGINLVTLLAAVRDGLSDWRRSMQDTMDAVAEASANADLLITHGLIAPFAHAIHQHKHIPMVSSAALPSYPTQAFANPFFPPIPWGQRFYNPLTHRLTIRWVMLSVMLDPMNVYRRRVGLPRLSAGQMMRVLLSDQIPLAMHYSPHLVPIPSDWGKHVHVVGTWLLPPQTDWTSPAALSAFLAQGEPPVFISFGSMTVPNPVQMTQTISTALRLANLRGVLQAGWGSLAHEDEHLITIGDAPHDWLFPRMTAIVHHGGSGTTHAALQAGKPALVVPFIADQPFWGRRIAELGVGVPPIAPKKLTPERLAATLRTLTQDTAMQQRAAELGALLRAEDGLAATCDLVQQYVT